MGKKYISLNENEVNSIVESSLMRILMEAYEEAELDDSWYDEQDRFGKSGDIGDARLYEIPNNDIRFWKDIAKQLGERNVGRVILRWFMPERHRIPWSWDFKGIAPQSQLLYGNGIFHVLLNDCSHNEVIISQTHP